jgi:transporter family-2 protein
MVKMQHLLFVGLALMAGAILPMQVGMNATLRQSVGSPIWASLTSFSVGTLCLGIYALLSRLAVPSIGMLSAAPAWSWFGGMIGAMYVTLSIVLAPKLGSATLISATIAGQMLASVLIDHFGWLGFSPHPVGVERLLGVMLLFAGVLLIQRG